MKSFILILGAIVGLTFVIADDKKVEPGEREKTSSAEPRPRRSPLSLSERNAQRDTHRRTQLASVLEHSSSCNCGNH